MRYVDTTDEQRVRRLELDVYGLQDKNSERDDEIVVIRRELKRLADRVSELEDRIGALEAGGG